MIPRTVLREIAQQRMVLFHWLPVAMVGLSHMAFVPMEWGLQWLLGVADYFAQWPGATKPIITPAPWTGLAVTAAGLLLALRRGPYGRAVLWIGGCGMAGG